MDYSSMDYSVTKKSNTKMILIIVGIALVIIALAVGGYFIYDKPIKKDDTTTTAAPTTTVPPSICYMFAAKNKNGGGVYTLTFDNAQKIATALGGTLATKAQVTEAYNNGREWCAWSWTSEPAASNGGRVRAFPMQTKKRGCGEKGVNIGGSTINTKYCANVFGQIPTLDVQKQAIKTVFGDDSDKYIPTIA